MTELDTALPVPTGDPPLLTNLAKNLAYVASHGTDTVLARSGASGLDLGGSWAGPAFQAASTEAQAGARLSHAVCDRFGPVVCAVNQYAGQLANARRTVEALREQWLAADRRLAETAAQPVLPGADPAAALELTRAADAHRERTRAELLARHTACVRELETTENHAASSVSAALGMAGSPAAQRQSLLAQLPLTQGAASRATAVALVDHAVAGLDPDPTAWSVTDLEQVLVALAGSIDDPVVAQALMSRLGAAGLDHAAKTLGVGPGNAPFPDAAARSDALSLLEVAFAVSVSDRPARDPVSAAAVDQSRPAWIKQLLEQPLSSITDQLALVAAAATGPSRIVPGFTYAVGAAQALIARSGPLTDRLGWQPSTREGKPSLALGAAPDPYQLLFSAIQTDPLLARRVLVATGTHGETVVHDLVVERPLAAMGVRVPLTSSMALGELLTALASAPEDDAKGQNRLTTALLDSFGEVGQRGWQLTGQASVAVDAHLDPLRRPAAAMLSADPGRVSEAVKREVPAATTARWQAVLGEIAKDAKLQPDGRLDASALGTLLSSLAAFEADRLGRELASPPGPATTKAVDSAHIRLGRVIGFTAESGWVALTHAAGQLDAVNADDRRSVRQVAGLADLVPVSKAPGGKIVSVLLDPVRELLLRMFDNAHPVDNAAKAADLGDEIRDGAARLVEASTGDQARAALGYDDNDLNALSSNSRQLVAEGAAMVIHTGPVRMAAR